MADMNANKSSTWLWTLVLVIVIVLLFWLWKSGTLGGTADDDTVTTGPKVQICINNGGTWNEDTDSCDMPEVPSLVDTGDVDPFIETGTDENDIEVDEENEIDITVTGEIIAE